MTSTRNSHPNTSGLALATQELFFSVKRGGWLITGPHADLATARRICRAKNQAKGREVFRVVDSEGRERI